MILINKKDGSVITVPCIPNNNQNTKSKEGKNKMSNKYDVGMNNINFSPVSFDQVKKLKEKKNEM